VSGSGGLENFISPAAFTAAVGFAVAWLVAWFARARLYRSLDEEIKALQQREEASARPTVSGQQSIDLLKFLYGQRLALFNTRREYEWKIYFGVMILLGAGDASILANRVALAGYRRWWWIVACGFVVFVSLYFESHLQKRNATDRAAMDTLYNWLCDELLIPRLSPARERILCSPSRIWGWSSLPKVLLLIFAGVVSAVLPFVQTTPDVERASVSVEISRSESVLPVKGTISVVVPSRKQTTTPTHPGSP
jgi:hypothetical protein